MLLFKTATLEQMRPLSSDERRAEWAEKYFGAGYHRTPSKPRIKVTVPAPINTETKEIQK